MKADTKRAADERLAAALEQAGLADRREDYRGRLRGLKKENAEAFRKATEHYEQVVVPGLLDADPVGVWIEFGIALALMQGPGRAVAVDPTGRSAAWSGTYAPGDLVLFVPDDRQADALPLAVPGAPSAAQAATVDLLVLKKLAL